MAPPPNRRPGFSRRAQYGVFIGYVVAVAGGVIGAVLLTLATLDPSAFANLRVALAEATTPLSSGMASVARAIGSVPGAIGDHFNTVSENRALRREVDATHQALLSARAIQYDNRRLKALLKIRDEHADVIVAARLVSSSASSTRRFAVINAGSRQGVREGQPVRGPEGLIGRILEVGPDSARVLLLTDPDSVVPVRRTKDGSPAIAAGRGDGLIEIRPVNLGAAVFNPGDIIVTSGTGGIFAPNVPVAHVVRRTGSAALALPYARAGVLDVAVVSRAFFTAPPPPSPDQEEHP